VFLRLRSVVNLDFVSVFNLTYHTSTLNDIIYYYKCKDKWSCTSFVIVKARKILSQTKITIFFSRHQSFTSCAVWISARSCCIVYCVFFRVSLWFHCLKDLFACWCSLRSFYDLQMYRHFRRNSSSWGHITCAIMPSPNMYLCTFSKPWNKRKLHLACSNKIFCLASVRWTGGFFCKRCPFVRFRLVERKTYQQFL
jgi:hypothetical protein